MVTIEDVEINKWLKYTAMKHLNRVMNKQTADKEDEGIYAHIYMKKKQKTKTPTFIFHCPLTSPPASIKSRRLSIGFHHILCMPSHDQI